MIIPKTREEIEIMRSAALLVSKTLGMLATEIEPAVTTLTLDKLSEQYIGDNRVIPRFLRLNRCPATLLTSVNEKIVHRLPTGRPLEDGDVVSCDLAAIVDG